MYNELKLAEEQLVEEPLHRDKIKEDIKILSKNLNENNYEAFSFTLNKIVETIRPLNVAEIRRLIAKSNDASDQIMNKDVVIFLGYNLNKKIKNL